MQGCTFLNSHTGITRPLYLWWPPLELLGESLKDMPEAGGSPEDSSKIEMQGSTSSLSPVNHVNVCFRSGVELPNPIKFSLFQHIISLIYLPPRFWCMCFNLTESRWWLVGWCWKRGCLLFPRWLIFVKLYIFKVDAPGMTISVKRWMKTASLYPASRILLQ